MKKLMALFTILTITLSVSLMFSCDSGSFCCENIHTSTSECSSCSPHLGSSFSIGALHPEFIFSPTIVGHIFFAVINIRPIDFVLSLDRPPTLHS